MKCHLNFVKKNINLVIFVICCGQVVLLWGFPRSVRPKILEEVKVQVVAEIVVNPRECTKLAAEICIISFDC